MGQEQHSWHRGCWSRGFSHEPGSPHKAQLPLELLSGFAGRKSCSTAPSFAEKLCKGAGNTAGAGAAPGTAGDSQGQVELEDKENPGMLLVPTAPSISKPDTEQLPGTWS